MIVRFTLIEVFLVSISIELDVNSHGVLKGGR